MKIQAAPTRADDDRAVDIYVHAARIFHEKGYDATSMSDLAEAVGLTKAGLYYYIESKEDLLFAIMNFGMDCLERDVIEPARAEPDAEKRLRLILEAHARQLAKGDKAITTLTDEVAALTPRHRKRILERKRRYFDLLRDTLDELKKAGKLQDVDTTVATFSLFGTLLWLPRWYRPGGRLDSNQVIEQLTRVGAGGAVAGEDVTKEPSSWVDDDFPSRAAKQHLQAVEHIPAEDSLLARQVCLELARILLTIEPDPNQKADGHRHSARDPRDHAGHTLGWVQVQLLAVRPGQRRCIGSCVGDDAI